METKGFIKIRNGFESCFIVFSLKLLNIKNKAYKNIKNPAVYEQNTQNMQNNDKKNIWKFDNFLSLINKTVSSRIIENITSEAYCLKNIEYRSNGKDRENNRVAKNMESLCFSILKAKKENKNSDRMPAEKLIEHIALSLTPKFE